MKKGFVVVPQDLIDACVAIVHREEDRSWIRIVLKDGDPALINSVYSAFDNKGSVNCNVATLTAIIEGRRGAAELEMLHDIEERMEFLKLARRLNALLPSRYPSAAQ